MMKEKMSQIINPREEFQFFYLANLTLKKVKPLSRWEKPVSNSGRQWLRDQGLKTEIISRKTENGNRIYETIFSTSHRYLNFYRRKFDHRLLSNAPETSMLEGFLFGYPSCCVQQFIQRPYRKNRLPGKLQRRLFHWACCDCRVTPELLPYYLPVCRDTLQWYRQEFPAKKFSLPKTSGKWSWAAALALWISASSLSGQVIPDSSHYIPVPNDLDLDFLSDAEEVYVGTSSMTPYTLPGITDVVYWTGFFKYLIDTLPATPQPDRPYREDFCALGVESCWKCSTDVNMGFVRIINPLRNLHMDIPFMGLHFMDYHSLAYSGSIHQGRVNLDTLKQILYPYQPVHLLGVTGDTDQDGLTDAEEDSLNFDPGNPDTNGDDVPDGPEVAEQLVRLLPLLPELSDNMHSRITHHPMWGFENCNICGAAQNMGYVEFANPENGRSFQLHYNGLHALAHGSFAYDGSQWPNQRAAAVDLYRSMKTHQLFIAGDRDRDGLRDGEESRFGYDPAAADSDGDGMGDGMELAITMKNLLDNLPTLPPVMGPFVLHHPTFGHWNCLICGEAVNMGYLEIWHPLINGPMTITYYAYHFLARGSFAHEGRIDVGQWITGRINPVMLAAYLDVPVGIISPPGHMAGAFSLYQNYPNPFNPATIISYEIPDAGRVRLEVYNLLGQRVKLLVNSHQSPGSYRVKWDGTSDAGKPLASGIYLLRMTSGKYSATRKMVLMR